MTDTTGPTSQGYFSQRLRLHYADWGNESAPPLLLIHGSMDHCRNWDWVARALRDDYHIVAPDLRGHGDSQWLVGSSYQMLDYIYDIAQLVEQKKFSPVTIIGHSMGAAISLYYAGLYPEKVDRIIAIEGLGPSPEILKERASTPDYTRLLDWILTTRKLSGRQAKRYVDLDTALQRMRAENPHLSAEQAKHLTIHGSNQNEDGTYSWKFDNYARNMFPGHLLDAEVTALFARISCPVLLVRGAESWASDPSLDGRLAPFQNAQSVNVKNAGHWVHHDQLSVFLRLVRTHLKK